MRKLTLLLFALAIALYAQSVVAEADSATGYVLRDSLILFAVAAAIFGLGAGALADVPIAGTLRRWPLAGRALAGLSLGAAVAAATFGLGGAGGLAAWLAGLILLASGVWLQGEPLHEGAHVLGVAHVEHDRLRAALGADSLEAGDDRFERLVP